MQVRARRRSIGVCRRFSGQGTMQRQCGRVCDGDLPAAHFLLSWCMALFDLFWCLLKASKAWCVKGNWEHSVELRPKIVEKDFMRCFAGTSRCAPRLSEEQLVW